MCEVLNQRILEEDCLETGWVLTGFPFTDVDFKYLDTLDTPPNRCRDERYLNLGQLYLFILSLSK